jgi:hypothetical protein
MEKQEAQIAFNAQKDENDSIYVFTGFICEK